MDHCKDSENEIIHSILCVKLEPFEEDEDCTQNLDPLQPDSHVHTQVELLQGFKMEIESDSSDQVMNELIQEDILKNDPGDTGTKIEEINVNTKYIGNEASLDDVLDSPGIIEDDTSVHRQLTGNISKHTGHGSVEIQKQTGEKNNTRYELSHSCGPHSSDVIKVEPSTDANLLYTTSLINHSRDKSATCTSGVDVLRIHKHSTSDEEGSKQSKQPSLVAHSLPPSSYVCDVYGVKFQNSRNLVTDKVVCKKELKRSSHSPVHKIIRTNRKPFVCDICEKRFRYSHHLTTHKHIHTGQKPYVCDICKKGFSQSSHLITHKRIHTGQKPYACDICEKCFSDLSTLITHKRIHTGQKPYVCDICKKRFNQSSNLVTHKRIHTGQKPYVCDVCKKGFNRSSHLVRHKRTHTGEKPYVCDICKNRFSQPSALITHKRTQHGQRSCV